MALIDARGSVLGKDELMRPIWPDRVVEENNLQLQFSTLGKVFGPNCHLMQTVAWRGYQFTGEVRLAAAPTSAVLAPSQMTNPFPAPVSELIRAWRGYRFGLT